MLRPLKLSMNTSVLGSRAFRAWWCGAWRRFRKVERMPTFTSVTRPSCSKAWSRATCSTSAPYSASVRAAQVPAITWVSATALMPESGWVGLAV